MRFLVNGCLFVCKGFLHMVSLYMVNGKQFVNDD